MALVCMLAGTDPADTVALETGFAFAKTLDLDLVAQSALPDATGAVVFASSPYVIGLGAGAVEQVKQAQTDLVTAWRGVFDTVAARHPGVTARYDHQTQLTERAAAQAAILADTLVFPRPAGRSGHILSSAFETVLMDERLPVVLAGSQPAAGETVGVAWNGSAQAARAVRLHLPLIRAAKRVVLLQNPEDLPDTHHAPSASVEALGAYLDRQGVTAETAAVTGSVGPALLSACETRGIDLLVAGAFGHSRAGQFLFGGASRDFLTADNAPALAFAH
ncbi:MAG: universal stress protein [Pseudomonadota bacterium]